VAARVKKTARAGVYSVWRGPAFIYVGMSCRGMTEEDVERHRMARSDRGLATRLASHASGRRSGDQFCVYVADRPVLPLLTHDEVIEIAAGQLSFDSKVKDFISRELACRFVVVEDAETAFRVEQAAKIRSTARGEATTESGVTP